MRCVKAGTVLDVSVPPQLSVGQEVGSEKIERDILHVLIEAMPTGEKPALIVLGGTHLVKHSLDFFVCLLHLRQREQSVVGTV